MSTDQLRLVAGRYELGALLGSGGFAKVYRARDHQRSRDVAVKIIPLADEGLLALGPDDAPSNFERFRHEALSLSRLRSPHIARVHDFGRDATHGFYLVMDLVDGVPLDVRSLGRALTPAEVMRAARALLAALAEAHVHGIIHRDIKPHNVLVPGGLDGLDAIVLLDFGIARSERRAQVQEAIGSFDTRDGVVLGTPAYMAPEQLMGGATTFATDIYSAGLLLFELLGCGPLFPGSAKEQLAARVRCEPSLDGRLDGLCHTLLSRMLARDPAARFADGSQALDAMGELVTAPLQVSLLPRAHPGEGITKPSELEGRSPGQRITGAPRTPPWLARLSDAPSEALEQALLAMDLAMLDALARRQGSSEEGLAARAMALAFRLELDAAADVVGALRGPLLRGVASCVIIPRARRAITRRVDQDPRDAWVDELPAGLAGLLATLGAALMAHHDLGRSLARSRRALARLDAVHTTNEARAKDGDLATTLRMAVLVAEGLAGQRTPVQAVEQFISLRDGAARAKGIMAPLAPFHVLLRALLLGALTFRADEHQARDQLERAARLAAEVGAPLLECRASVAWGGMLVEVPNRVGLGLEVLERATTLLAHGDAPSLQHIAEHNRGAALIIEGRYAEAAPTLRRARETAVGELSDEHEALSCMNESFAYLALGQGAAAEGALATLSDEKLSRVSGRTAAYVHVARALHALAYGELDAARTAVQDAQRRAGETEASGGDAYLLTEAVSMLCACARGESVDLLARAGALEKVAQDRGLPAFYWFEVLRAVLRHAPPAVRQGAGGTLERLVLLLAPLHQVRMT